MNEWNLLEKQRHSFSRALQGVDSKISLLTQRYEM